MGAIATSREVEGSKTMVALKYVLMLVGAGIFGSTGALVVYDIYVSTQLRRLLRGKRGMVGNYFSQKSARCPSRLRAGGKRPLQRMRTVTSRRDESQLMTSTSFKNEIPFAQAKACAAAHR